MKRESAPKAQREHMVERGASVVAKVATIGIAKSAAKGSAKLAGKAVVRSVSPLLLVADGAQFATEVVLTQLGCENETAEHVGQGVGLCGSAGIGAAVGSVGGPPGAAVGAGVGAVVWLGGEVIGKGVARFTKWVSKGRAENA